MENKKTLYFPTGIVQIAKYLKLIARNSILLELLIALIFIFSNSQISQIDSSLLVKSFIYSGITLAAVSLFSFIVLYVVCLKLYFMMRQFKKSLEKTGISGLAKFYKSTQLSFNSLTNLFPYPSIYVYEFELNKSTISIISDSWIRLKYGDQLEVIYDPKNPAIARLKN